MSLNVGWHIRDKLWLMPKHGPLLWYFTSTETVRLIRMENPGWPPWLSHSSGTQYNFYYCWLLLKLLFFCVLFSFFSSYGIWWEKYVLFKVHPKQKWVSQCTIVFLQFSANQTVSLPPSPLPKKIWDYWTVCASKWERARERERERERESLGGGEGLRDVCVFASKRERGLGEELRGRDAHTLTKHSIVLWTFVFLFVYLQSWGTN